MDTSRRHFIYGLGASLGSVALTDMLAREGYGAASASAIANGTVTPGEGPLAPKPQMLPAKAKACIFLHMEGGPSQMDTFDPKPQLSKLHLTESNLTAGLDPRSSLDIVMGVEQLFDRCIKTLKQTLELHKTAEELETEIAREPIMKRRERLIEDVRESVSTLGRILSGIQDLRQSDETGGELARLRGELDESLDVAKRVEDRLKAMDVEKDATGDGPEAAT